MAFHLILTLCRSYIRKDRKVANDFTKNLDFKEIKSLPKLDIILSASVFLDMKA